MWYYFSVTCGKVGGFLRFSTNKTLRHDIFIAEILQKVAFNTLTPTLIPLSVDAMVPLTLMV
jgi:hypothetical protein